MGQYKDIRVGVQTEPNGQWEQMNIKIHLPSFIEAKSPHVHVKEVIKMQLMGGSHLAIDFGYTQKQAKKDLEAED